MPPDVIDQVIEDIADGRTVDWLALGNEARTDEEREGLKYLRIVGGIADLHRSTDDPFEAASQASTRSAGHASTAQSSGPAEVWGRYRLIEKVGEGSFGSVHRAWDPELEREVAIKILHRHLADSQLKERLLREGRALAKVRHPNVVSVLGVESHEDRVGLCMEFVRGETLEAVLRTHGMLNAREAVLVGEDVCRALAAVHRAGFVHRDVKARNVMRERAGRIVLMDFGAGRQTDQKMAGRVDIVGTPVYMAPEVLAGEAASASSDVYSVGVLLYHLVTAEYPVDGRTMDELLEAHRHGRRRLLSERRPDLPMPFIRVVDRALAADPPQRYASAGAFLEALGTLSSEVQATPRTLVRHLIRAVVVVIGITCGLTGLGLLTSTVFNDKLGRSDFVVETAWDWFVWGFRSSVAPTLLLLMVLLGIAMLVVFRRLVLALSATLRQLDTQLQGHLNAGAHRLRLDEAPVLASSVLLFCVSALIGAWWYFSPLLGVLFNDSDRLISTAPVEDLALLSPRFLAYQQLFRQTFSGVAILTIIAWYPVARLVRQGQSLNWGIVAGGAIVPCLTIATLDLPYRLLIHNEFDVARWDGAKCYIIGQRSDDLLLFCPTLQPPRSRIVKSGTGSLEEPAGVRESIFTHFATYERSQP